MRGPFGVPVFLRAFAGLVHIVGQIVVVFPRFRGQVIKGMLEDVAAEEPRRGREAGGR